MPSTVLMVRPARFGCNPETAATNAFQESVLGESAQAVQAAALAEFDAFADALRSAGVEVHVVQDQPNPETPDAVFPNNWISFHAGRRVVLYPMQSALRRQEVRADVQQLFGSSDVLDLTGFAASGRFLEGTGSLVLDRDHKIAFACRSERTDAELAREVCEHLGYELVLFDAVDAGGRAIYHTNVMLSVGTSVAIVCSPAIAPAERTYVLSRLGERGRDVIDISLAQMGCFLGNALVLQGREGALIALSRSAESALEPEQRERLAQHGALVAADLATIERYGGGSARCMLAEVLR